MCPAVKRVVCLAPRQMLLGRRGSLGITMVALKCQALLGVEVAVELAERLFRVADVAERIRWTAQLPAAGFLAVAVKQQEWLLGGMLLLAMLLLEVSAAVWRMVKRQALDK